MPARRAAVRVTTTVVILAAAGLAGTQTALALLSGRGTGTVTASTGTWAAVATTTGSPPYGPVVLTFTKAKPSTPPQYLWIANTGTLNLTGVTTEVVLSAVGTGSLAICSTTWNETTGGCSGTITVLDTQLAGSTTTALTLPAGARLRVKATAQPKTGTFTMTVNVSVARALARPPATVGS